MTVQVWNRPGLRADEVDHESASKASKDSAKGTPSTKGSKGATRKRSG